MSSRLRPRRKASARLRRARQCLSGYFLVTPYRLGFVFLITPMRSIVLTFGLIILSCLILFEVAKFSLIKHTLPIELMVGIFAALFLVIGILIAGKRGPAPAREPDKEPASPSPVFGIDQQKIDALGISRREYEVLQEIALGLSNQEIAAKLFVTESTIKTHISSLLVKLDAKRRTDAVRIAKELKIIN